MKKNGFSLVEIMIAFAFLTVGVLSMLWLNSASNRGSMDAYFEFLAYSLAREPIEAYRGFGYKISNDIIQGNIEAPAIYPVGSYNSIEFNPMAEIQYPHEAQMFERLIELEPVNAGGRNAIRVKVTVAAKGQSRVELWMRNQSVSLESLIVERPL